MKKVLTVVEKREIIEKAFKVILEDNCFYAFSDEQFSEGLKKIGVKEEEVVAGGNGLYGTEKTLDSLVYLMNLEKEYSFKLYEDVEYFKRKVYNAAWNREVGYAPEPFKEILEELNLVEKQDLLKEWQVNMINEAIQFVIEAE